MDTSLRKKLTHRNSSRMSKSLLVLLCLSVGSSAFIVPMVRPAHVCHPRAARHLEMKTPGQAREQLVPDLMKALDKVSKFISRVDDTEPLPPTAECIETYCKGQQAKIDLLLVEAEAMKAAGGGKVRWT